MNMDALVAAGKIARRVREEVPSVVEESAPLIEICDYVENRIREEGGLPAFPCNICINDVAAHYSPLPRDRKVVPPNALVKVDIGAQIDGYLADTAVTVNLDPEKEVLKIAAEKALERAVRDAGPNVAVSELGSVIYSTIKSYGLKPISNLTGHQISRYKVHAGLSIPNVPSRDEGRLIQGSVYAIEPFVTLPSAAGEVVSGQAATIYAVRAGMHRRLLKTERLLLQSLDEMFHGLPYSPRWISSLGEEALNFHRRLWMQGKIHGYQVLVERSGAPVAQAEHTVVITDNGCTIIT